MKIAERSTTRRFTVSEYHQMGDVGIFDGQRVQLIGGEVVVMSPQNFRHGSGLEEIAEILTKAFGARFWVRTQQPLKLRGDSEPEPDVYVVKGARREHKKTPTTAVLVIEVSDTTLRLDRRKRSLYAKAGIADFWLVNLRKNQLEVYRKPIPDDSQPFGAGYSQKTILVAGDVVSPLAKSEVKIHVANLIPPNFEE